MELRFPFHTSIIVTQFSARRPCDIGFLGRCRPGHEFAKPGLLGLGASPCVKASFSRDDFRNGKLARPDLNGDLVALPLDHSESLPREQWG